MTILVKIFGALRNKIKDAEPEGALPLNLHVNSENIEYISDILKKFLIKENETTSISKSSRKLRLSVPFADSLQWSTSITST